MCDGDWVRCDPAGGIQQISPREYLESWIGERKSESPDFRVAFQGLVDRGCDPIRLAWQLTSLTQASGWAKIGRSDVKGVAGDLEAAVAALRTLFFSQINRLLKADLMPLAGNLADLAKQLRSLAPTVERRVFPGRNVNRASLVHYVSAQTGHFYDEYVAPLVEMAESLPSIEGATASPRAYSTDAHIQWRNRDGAKALLDGPAEAVSDVLTAMEEDLGQS